MISEYASNLIQKSIFLSVRRDLFDSYLRFRENDLQNEHGDSFNTRLFEQDYRRPRKRRSFVFRLVLKCHCFASN